ncbi:MAG: periplasmic heavy metal sensor [Desulfobacteraceae bacterium]|nr:periplasmic heavy metal sensor [Desulfobacteraceae bacterium]
MKKQIIIVAALIFAIVGMSGTAFSWNHGQGHGKGHGQSYGKGMCQGGNSAQSPWADLTDEQKTQLQELHQKFIDDTAETRTTLGAKQAEMGILMQTSSPDREKLSQLITEIGDLKKIMMEKRLDFALEAKEIAPDVNFPAGCKGFGKRGGMGCFGQGSNQNPDCINQ